MLRFAPSTTADMQISDLRIAIFNYIVAQQKKEDLIIRIEDTNKEQNIEGKDNEILDLLNLFGIEYSQVIYQSENMRFHSAMALQLLHEKNAFSCFCSNNYIDKKRKEAKDAQKDYKYDDACRNLPAELVIDNTAPFTIRITKPNEDITIKDHIQEAITFKTQTLDSFIIMNQDKVPVYDFACAVDDMLNDISLVIRKEDYLNNSPKQEHIRKSLHYDKKIQYAHIPNILNNDNNTSNIKWLLQEGYLPDAIANYLLSIGNANAPQEIFSIKDAIKWFDLDKVSKSPTPFDIDILKDINRKHLKNLDNKELSRYVGFADESIGKLAKIYLEEVGTTKELKSKIKPIFTPKIIPERFKEEVNIMREVIKDAPYFEEYNDFKSYVMKNTGLKEENFFKPLSLLLSGVEDTPNIDKLYKYLKDYIGEIIK